MRTVTSRTASKPAELDPRWIEFYWQVVEACLQRVFGKSSRDSKDLVLKMQARMKDLPEQALLLLYHDAPLQTASILAGASGRELSDQELLAYDKLWSPPPDPSMIPTQQQ